MKQHQENLPTPENQPLPREAMASKLHDLIDEKTANSYRAGAFGRGSLSGERPVKKKLDNGESVQLQSFTDYLFRDYRFVDPPQRLMSSIKIEDGTIFRVWDMDPDGDKNQTGNDTETAKKLEVFVTRNAPPEVEKLKRSYTFYSVLENKLVNHLTTYGAFISDVEQERMQRLYNHVFEIEKEFKAVEPASDEEIKHLISMLEPSTD